MVYSEEMEALIERARLLRDRALVALEPVRARALRAGRDHPRLVVAGASSLGLALALTGLLWGRWWSSRSSPGAGAAPPPPARAACSDRSSAVGAVHRR